MSFKVLVTTQSERVNAVALVVHELDFATQAAADIAIHNINTPKYNYWHQYAVPLYEVLTPAPTSPHV